MLRKIVKIDEAKCNGCGLCVPSCAEGALQIIDGKAKLVKEIYCDGLGACLGDCPEGAITIEEREAEEFDEEAVKEHLEKQNPKEEKKPVFGGCPGMALKSFAKETSSEETSASKTSPSRLGQWPVQLMLIPPMAPFLKGAEILLCADCVPFAVPDFHDRYLKNRAVLVGCPKLDDLGHYREKLAAILKEAKPKSLTVLKMEVPCCSGLAGAAIEARDKSAPEIKVEIETIRIEDGSSIKEVH